MTFDDALAKLDGTYGLRTYEIPAEGRETKLIICSGGKLEGGLDSPPAMCLSKEIAIEMWLDAARKEFNKVESAADWDVLVGWKVDNICVDTWRITIQDAKQTHRIAASRYSAVADLVLWLREKPKPVEANLTAVAAAFEHSFAGAVCKSEGSNYYAPTGESFVTLTSGGIVKEGEARRCFLTEAEAIEAWRSHADVYRLSEPEGSILYWRERPVLTHAPNGWSVYSRLLISAEPAPGEPDQVAIVNMDDSLTTIVV